MEGLGVDRLCMLAKNDAAWLSSFEKAYVVIRVPLGAVVAEWEHVSCVVASIWPTCSMFCVLAFKTKRGPPPSWLGHVDKG